MEDWLTMKTLTAAHELGLRNLDDLDEAVKKLNQGNKAEAVGIFDSVRRFFESDLEMHFRHEERALFPVLARLIGQRGPIDAMLEEHDSIWRAIDGYVEAVQRVKDDETGDQQAIAQTLERRVKHVIWVLRSHIQKEDSMLFPLAEKTLDQAGRLEVDESVETLVKLYRTRA